jgi:[NiFe] hydrogenase assembly HybE family chaperone
MLSKTVFCRWTTEVTVSEIDLVSRYRAISRDKMQGLPICNPALEVEAVGFRALDQHRLGVLITPWFMNLMLLPGDDTWSCAADGANDTVSLPSERCEFIVSHDETTGTCLSAVLFRTLLDFPDQDTAVAVAKEVLERLFVPAAPAKDTREVQNVSRRKLLTGLGAS